MSWRRDREGTMTVVGLGPRGREVKKGRTGRNHKNLVDDSRCSSVTIMTS